MGKREDNKRRKREALLTCGLHAFTEQGWERSSIEGIAKDAGVARGTFYLYFEDKLALYAAVASPWWDALFAALEAVDSELADASDARSVYERMTATLVQLGLEHAELVTLQFRESRAPGEAGDWVRSQESRLAALVTRLTEHALRRGLIDVPDARVATLVVLGAVERLFWEFLEGDGLPEPLEAADAALRVLARGLGL